MSHGKISLAIAVALGMTLGAVNGQAQEEAPAINNGNVSFTVYTDVVTEYWFRGIPQENQGLIVQPGADVTFGLISNDDFSLDAYFGTWNSFHWGDSTTSTPDLANGGPAGSNGNDNVWYESDIFVGATVGFGSFSVDFGYTWLYGPNAGAEFAEEIYATLAYDDSELWGDSFDGVQPYATIVFEIDGGSDGLAGFQDAAGSSAEKGIYLELGIAPTFDLTDSLDMPITLAIPVTVGFSLDDYYETVNPTTGLLEDDDFGFFQIGAVLSMPLESVPAEYGAWEVSAGIYYLSAGDIAENDPFGVTSAAGTNDGDDDTIWASFGIAMSY